MSCYMMSSLQSTEAIKMSNDASSVPICTFGIISDIQYADVDDTTDYYGIKKRYYRRSLELVKTAVDDWNKQCNKISFILQLGDIIDIRNAARKTSSEALEAVMHELEKSVVPVYHVVGNHELYNFTRAELFSCNYWMKGIITLPAAANAAYYHWSPSRGLRIVVLDQYEISILGLKENSIEYRLAMELLTRHNRNEDLHSPNGLHGGLQRYVGFNGAVSTEQLNWLEMVLQKAELDGELVLVAGHIPIWSGVSCYEAICWNYEKLTEILHRYRCVLGYFSGHTHEFRYKCDAAGLHHIVFPGVVEALPQHSTAHATVSFFSDHVVVSSRDSAMLKVIELRRDRK